MINREIRYRVISDIHLFHANTPTVFILNNLTASFDDFRSGLGLDIVFIAGDVFEKAVDLSNPASSEVLVWVARFMDYCRRNCIKLRVLEGTPSHDNKQSKIFQAQYDSYNETEFDTLDFKYIEALQIEIMQDVGLSVLYVPDEYATPDICYEQSQELMKHNGLEKIDIAIMHGAFEYQLPDVSKAPKHNEDKYLEMIRYCISIGHIHTHSVYSRIIAQGSFDRLRHGEEEPKGCVEIVLQPNGEFVYFFVENKTAMIYKTVDVTVDDVDKAIDLISKRTRTLPADSYVRIRSDSTNPVILGFDEVKKRFPLFHMSKITYQEEKEEKEHRLIDSTAEVVDYIPIHINKENIVDMVMREVESNHSLSKNEINLGYKILASLK